MSKRVESRITCPACRNQYDFTLYRTIWGEESENRDLVMTDKVNVGICPACGTSYKIPYPFMYTNRDQHFAVWWEPEYDPQIDSDQRVYTGMVGPNHYLAAAPRVKDWEDFKFTILKYERGVLEGSSERTGKEMRKQMDGFLQHIEKTNKKKKGCLGVLFFCLVACPVIWLAI